MTTVRTVLVGLGAVVAFAVVACSGSSSSSNDVLGNANSAGSGEQAGTGSGTNSGSNTGTETPPKEEVTPPRPKLVVDSSIISASLGEDCAKEKVSGDFCAPTPGGGGCGGIPCQPSNLQLSFKAGEGSAAKVTIRSVTLHDAKSGKKLGTLVTSLPKSWTGSAYTAWNEILSPNTEVKASYEMTSPAWETLGDTSYTVQYRILVVVDVDGATETLESTTLSREPPVVT